MRPLTRSFSVTSQCVSQCYRGATVGQHLMLGEAEAETGGSRVTGAECGSNPQICG